jgi:hypothetical protein
MSINKECNLSKYIVEVLKDINKWNETTPKKYNIKSTDNNNIIKWKVYRHINESGETPTRNRIERNIEGSN